MRLHIAGLGLLALVLGLAGCSQRDSEPGASAPSQPGAPPAQTDAPPGTQVGFGPEYPATELTDQTFETFALKSKGPAVVEFYSLGCGYCRVIAPALGELARNAGGRYKVGILDIDRWNQTQNRYGVTGTPTFIFFKDGRIADRVVGAPSTDPGQAYQILTQAMENLL